MIISAPVKGPGEGVTAPGSAPKVGRSNRSSRAADLLPKYGILGILILLVIVAQLLYPRFLTIQNLADILSQNAAVGIVAIAMTFVIISGGFDLSVGSIYALAGTVFAGMTLSASVGLGFGAALLVGLVLGFANGVLVAYFNVNPFIATLGTGSVILGLAYLYSNSSPFIVRDAAFKMLGAGQFAGIRIPIVALIVVAAVAWILLAFTPYGRNVQAVGSNAEASRLSGLPVPWIKISVYMISGAAAAFAGTIDASRLSVGQADVGSSIALDAIAIVVVGGTSLRGGEGAIWRTLVGLLIFASLTNVFYSLNLSQNWQLIAKGLIVVIAVTVDARLRRRA